jgi:alanyl-tRNA synthetase
MSHERQTPEPTGTRRLYFEDAYLREFEAAVVEKGRHEHQPAVVLDQTGFYPESGGQPADTGTLAGVSVTAVIEQGNRIVHVLDEELAEVRVEGKIDWARRFDHMQQHSGQHILSQCFIEVLDGETRSFHLGETVSSLEIGIRDISEEDLERVETRANEIVFQDLEVKTYFVPENEVDSIPLRRPPKKEGLLRIVEISGFDYSACGGTHVRRTGEVGPIKIIGWEKIRGNLRFEFLCGGRAVRDYAQKTRLLAALSSRLSSQDKDIPAAVDKLIQEGKTSRKKIRKLAEELAVFEAQAVIKRETGKIIRKVWTEKTLDEARLLALNIIRAGEFVVLYGVRGEDRSHLVLARSENFAVDLRELLPLIFARVKGKGGGSPSLVDILLERGEDTEVALDTAAEWLQSRIQSDSA